MCTRSWQERALTALHGRVRGAHRAGDLFDLALAIDRGLADIAQRRRQRVMPHLLRHALQQRRGRQTIPKAMAQVVGGTAGGRASDAKRFTR
jgi:hypothetical protein